MRAVIASDVFAAANTQPTALIRLCDIGFEGRHRIEAENEADPRFVQWMEGLSEPFHQACRLAFDAGLEAEAREPSRFAIHVVADPMSDWTARPPQLTLRDALSLLEAPFSILMEDQVSDRAFLLAMATPEQRRWLRDRERKDWLRFEHGGGVSSMPRPAREHKNKSFPEARVFVLFDSDALRPGAPGKHSETLRACCEEHPPLAHHQLRRRASENYLPRETLKQHAQRPHQHGEKRLAAFEAYARLRDEQRFHYNMKQGLLKDARNASADAGALYSNLSAEDREALGDGLGPDVGALFGSEEIAEHLLQSDGGWAEMNPIVCSIIEMLR